ncbi:TetR family transcriptional regulator [Skermanella stibiiresistens SB22]|uniref:TetR family transcriptional regulator n=1 Tax=Skermanella stibiiresistens SB22 TaxID=1385369 RepID=W9GRC3_9PROT|nr:TetR family transcriptional regulator [Skermanella stibiiresistens]EWY36455.1 TetR family transcriptional regulator [Skermanella stibiiresistens SB22]
MLTEDQAAEEKAIDENAVTPSGRPSRRNDPERTRRDILAVATKEFADHGLTGARVDAIAARTRTTKRAIYYYFGSKEGLYVAVLEKAYGDIRAIEASLHLEDLDPERAIRKLVEFTVDYNENNPDFVRLVSIENIHRAEHMAASKSIQNLNVAIIQIIEGIVRRGQVQGIFRDGIDPVDLHMLISAFCFFRVSNRHTFGAIFGQDFSDPAYLEKHKRIIGDSVLAWLKRS